jgi:hypothetical protein
MDDSDLNEAIVDAIGHTAAPHVDKARLITLHGKVEGDQIAAAVLALVREANAMPIEWGDMTLVQGVNDIMARFRKLHPDL